MMKKLYTFSYDMFLITTDRTKCDRPALSTFPLGVGYIESENKNIVINDIYDYMLKTNFSPISDDPFLAKYKKPCLSVHPCCSGVDTNKLPYMAIPASAIQIYGDMYIVVNNIRKIH